jgi:hypothetical protein
MAKFQHSRARVGTWAFAAALSVSFIVGTSANAGQIASSSNPVSDNTADGAAMTADLVLARPLGLAATVLGGAIFIVGLPFEALSGDVSGPARRLIVEPAKFTFTRPLGQMD